MENSSKSFYQEQLNQTNTNIIGLKSKINLYSLTRLFLFLASIAGLFFTINYSAWLSIGFVTLMLVLFLFLVRKQSLLQSNLTHFKHCATLLENEISILKGGDNLYSNGANFTEGIHPYTSDLDIFGKNSLFAYLNRAVSTDGKQFIANWLQNPETPSIIYDRANALQELNTMQAQNLNFRAHLFSLKADDLNTLKKNIETHLSTYTAFVKATNIKYIVIGLPLITFALLATAVVFNGIYWTVFSLQLLVNFAVYNFLVKRINLVHSLINKTNDALKTVAHLIKNIETTQWQTTYIQEIVGGLKNPNKHKAYNQIYILFKIVTQLDYRSNVLVGIVLNLFFCWDLRVIIRLHKWQHINSGSLVNSFTLLSHFEALISLTTLNHNHPNWVQPIITSEFCFEAENMAHPLIADNKKVGNNFNFSQKPTADIITGSNMAGKSTFLRTMGINMILAYTGANVCATYFKTSVFSLVSYMRIIDSLDAETSTFKAEINRLKMILKLTQSSPNTLVLIDEMLRGTNSKDKYEGSKALLEKLVSQQTPTLFATHDLQIAQLQQQHPSQVRNFNFDVKIEDDKMFFDYKIKQGECKTFNAAVLLKAIGLG